MDRRLILNRKPAVRSLLAPGLAAIAGAACLPAWAGQEYAEVLSATPIAQEVRVSRPSQQCYNQRVVYNEDRGDSLAGTLLGGLAGGLLGHTVGRGAGNFLATAAGAVVGAAAGNSIARSADGDEREGYEQRCQTVYSDQYETRAEGYDVTYRYHGEIYHTRMAYDPGSRIPVDVRVSPAGY